MSQQYVLGMFIPFYEVVYPPLSGLNDYNRSLFGFLEPKTWFCVYLTNKSFLTIYWRLQCKDKIKIYFQLTRNGFINTFLYFSFILNNGNVFVAIPIWSKVFIREFIVNKKSMFIFRYMIIFKKQFSDDLSCYYLFDSLVSRGKLCGIV